MFTSGLKGVGLRGGHCSDERRMLTLGSDSLLRCHAWDGVHAWHAAESTVVNSIAPLRQGVRAV